MEKFLFEYRLNPTTWAYLSAMMTIGIYFKFSRFWSVRNLDLVGLILFSPALLLVYYGALGRSPGLMQTGYVWLFSMSGFFLVRLLLDPVMVRRPLLKPNLSLGGLAFTGVALAFFLMVDVTVERENHPERLEEVLPDVESEHGPGYAFFYAFAGLSNQAIIPADRKQGESHRRQLLRKATTRTAAILGHLAIVVGMVLIGYRHFANLHTGVATASLYLLLPYASEMTTQVDHVIPGALLVWAVAAYRRPAVAGVLLGLAAGVVFYPLFLLPLWCGFYWRRGLVRFLVGMVAVLLILVAALAFTSVDTAEYLGRLQRMLGWTSLWPKSFSGFWEYHEPYFRIPVMAAFAALCAALALWPAQKNLGTLLSLSPAVMLAAQFWHAQHGGLHMAWFLPLTILTIFRPNLEDRVALTAVSDSWVFWRKKRVAAGARR